MLWIAKGILHAQSASAGAVVVIPQDATAPVNFGAAVLRDGLVKRGFWLRDRPSQVSTGLKIIVNTVNSGKSMHGKLPQNSESYVISLSPDKRTAFVDGSDATGTMYGELELAEQIAAWQSNATISTIRPEIKSPFLEIRGVNMFLTVQDIDDSNGAFWSDDYWSTYLDILARDRYNFLDIHGPCDAVTLTFPNGFSYFVSLPDFPEVGVGPARAAKNIARFRQVIQMAADRGIHVGYMNYEAKPPVGPWKTRKFGVDERWTKVSQEFLEGPQLETYTREAVSSFLKQLPGLWMFGFRIGESGQPEDFYKKTYLAALSKLPPTLRIYVRTWIANPEKIRDFVASATNPVYIEPKYNGEQLGLPYQAALGGRQYRPSGSFEDYTDKPQNFSILWQIRAHGTHRVFYWGSPEFARRTVRSCKFGNGVGFAMEPMDAYMPAADYLHNNPKIDHHFYKWTVQREWIWHLIWGRTAYDPDVPDQVFVNAFISHFGPQAGPLVFQSLAESSKIVPFIYAYHNIGMDHQEFAPEFETGDHALGSRSRLWQGTRLVPYGGNNDDFLRVNTFDRTAMASPSVYVHDRLYGISSGKMTPLEAAQFLNTAAAKSEAAIEEAGKLNPDSAKNFDCIRLDIEAVAWLGRYYRDRILSATHLAFYEQAYVHSELTLAYDYMHRAIGDWDRLSDITEQHFGFVPEYIRMGVKRFRWREEEGTLSVDLNQLNDLETEFRHLPEKNDEIVILGHVPPVKASPGKPLTLTVTLATAQEEPLVYMLYRNSQQMGYTRLDLMCANKTERTWSGVIPGDQVVPGFVEYYFGAVSGRWGVYDETVAHRPPYRVLVNRNNFKPIVSFVPPVAPVIGKSVDLAVTVEAKAPAQSVRVYYKRMPSYYEWLSREMSPAGDGRYTATVPLTPEGILYYFEALDEDGNGTNYPHFLEQTPYLVIDSWLPAAMKTHAQHYGGGIAK